MQNRLPEKCDLYQLADRGASITGSWPISKMPRLLEMLESDEGEASVELHFARSGKLRYLTGTVTAEIGLTCQRCMELMKYPVNTAISLALIETEAQADSIPEEYEPLVTEGPHFLPDVIEDELILAVPIVPTHDNQCSDYINGQEAVAEELTEETEKKPNPFAVLKDMM